MPFLSFPLDFYQTKMEHTARRYGTELEQRMQHAGVAAQVPEDLKGYGILMFHN